MKAQGIQTVYSLWFETNTGKELPVTCQLVRSLQYQQGNISKALQDCTNDVRKYRRLTKLLFPPSLASPSSQSPYGMMTNYSDIRCYELYALFVGSLSNEAIEIQLRHLIRMIKDSFL